MAGRRDFAKLANSPLEAWTCFSQLNKREKGWLDPSESVIARVDKVLAEAKAR